MILMSAVRNAVPEGEQLERWESCVCPQCGKACWKPRHPRLKKPSDHLVFLCTVCAAKEREDRLAAGPVVYNHAEGVEPEEVEDEP